MNKTKSSELAFEKSLDRRSYKLWSIPRKFVIRHGIVDKQEHLFEIRLNNTVLGTERFRVTSGEELYLPADYQRKVEYRKGVLTFTLLSGARRKK